jgi:hypothetical protein
MSRGNGRTSDGPQGAPTARTRRLWKLPEPWTHSTRPPLLGNPQTQTGFPQRPQAVMVAADAVSLPGSRGLRTSTHIVSVIGDETHGSTIRRTGS